MEKKWIVLQQEIKDCGVCSLLSIIKFYNGYVPLEKLREDTFTTKDGTTAYHLVNTARKYNFDATGIECEFDDLNKIVQPFIAHVVINGYQHFIVVYKVYNDKVVVMDPAIGKNIIPKNIFIEQWSNRIIELTPRTQIPSYKKSLNTISLMLKLLPSEIILILKLFITSVLLTILSILSSTYIKTFLNTYLTYGISNVILIFSFIIIFKLIINYIRSRYEIIIEKNIDKKVTIPFLEHLFSLPLNYIANKTTGEIMTRIDELKTIKNVFSKLLVTLMLDLLTFIVASILLINTNLELFLILILFLIIYVIIGVVFKDKIYTSIIRNINYQTEYNSLLIEYLNGYLTYKEINEPKLLFHNIEKRFNNYIDNTHFFKQLINKYNILKEYVYEICFFLIYSLGLIYIVDKRIELVDLVFFSSIAIYIVNPIKNIVDILPDVNYIKACVSKSSELKDIPKEDLDESSNEIIKGDISIKNLKYSYNNYNYVIEDFNLNIKEKEKVIMVGQSGCGKSTICKILYGLLNNYEGEVIIGNRDLLNYNLYNLRNNITYQSQIEYLFNDTLKNNIVCYKNVPEKQLSDILKICHVDEILKRKNISLDTIVTDNGSNFSGGERQRIILARSLIKASNILLLDEALNEIPLEMERFIVKDICNYFKNKTIIYVSHRKILEVFDRVIRVT